MVAFTALALLLSVVALPGCNRERSCTAELTAPQGSFRGIIGGTRSQTVLAEEALRMACGKLCSARAPSTEPGCVSQCAADAEAGKIGLRAACTEASR